MKRVAACLVVLVSVLVAPQATAQFSPQPQPYWSPRQPRPAESAREVVMTWTTPSPGEWRYYTRDGDCDRYPSAGDPANSVDAVSPPDCGRPIARAGEDYVAVRGEWTFTEPGSRTIRIPIIDDDLDETDGEAFSINLTDPSDVTETTACCNAYIYIDDDDPRDEDGDAPPPVVVTTVARAGQPQAVASTVASAPPPASPPGSAPRPAVSTTVATAPRDLEVALPSGELEPGPGFELVIERDPERTTARDARSGGSAPWLPLGLGGAAVGSGGIVWLRRQSRWSPTRS